MKKTALAALFATVPLVLAPTAASAFACYDNLSGAVGTMTSIVRDEFITPVCKAHLQPGTDRRDVTQLREVVIPQAIANLAGMKLIYERSKPVLDGLVEKCFSPEDYCNPEAIGRAVRCIKAELPDVAMASLGPDTLTESCDGFAAVAKTDPEGLRERARTAAESYIAYLRT
ncbi:hypothetical protein [Nocardia sp. NRRL S-836]|uniref:hypothetical protein n=1 Tax=Nocardia sp. NRRL S-836 TaxID=1519492 RepID=UPI0006AEA21A|nr:hypothetical protein [Nocardia sp. NRRL S-836]KOV86703.1 hypothetical protein ADL03_08275 [Nocardia sp. NRRL S-836]